MSEYIEICKSLKEKGAMESISRLIDMRKELLNNQMLSEDNKDKVWDIRNNLKYIDEFKKDIIAKSKIE